MGLARGSGLRHDRASNFAMERAAWDVFSIGFYRDLKRFAESADFSTEQEEAAAKTAGFQAADRIGTYLRSLMAEHHDTLAVAVK